MVITLLSLICTKGNAALVSNQSEKCNYNPNLEWFNHEPVDLCARRELDFCFLSIETEYFWSVILSVWKTRPKLIFFSSITVIHVSSQHIYNAYILYKYSELGLLCSNLVPFFNLKKNPIYLEYICIYVSPFFYHLCPTEYCKLVWLHNSYFFVFYFYTSGTVLY